MAIHIGSAELRLIDANANRAREGIRTGEDYIRFIVGSGRWAGRLKALRHSVSQLLSACFSDEELTAGRNVPRDPLKPGPGDAIEERQESSRVVALRGLKRAQEALRVLEEYTRAHSPEASVQFAQHRFALYEAEQWLLHASATATVVAAARLYVLLTKSLCRRGLLPTAEAVLKGGATLIQFREKERIDDKALVAEAHDLRGLCAQYGAVLICNDRLDIALAVEAAGVHLGQTDLPPPDARRVAGEKLIIGRSTHSVAQAQYAVEVEQADYIGVGSVFDTSTKQQRVLAGAGLAAAVCGLNLGVPVFAIGGITMDRVAQLKAAGVTRVAVSSAIVADPDPEAATRRFIELLGD